MWIGLIAACSVLSCRPSEDSEPCVRGFEPGDVLGVTVLEPYDETSSFALDWESYFGPAAHEVLEPAFADCDPSRDLGAGERLVFDAVKRVGEADDGRCSFLALSLRDTPTLTMGSATLNAAGTVPAEYLGVAVHPYASIDGCERSWSGTLLARPGGDPLEPPVTGNVPSVLLSRDVAPTDPGCAYSEPQNSCLMVVELEKL